MKSQSFYSSFRSALSFSHTLWVDLMTKNERRNFIRARKWEFAGRIKVSRGCENEKCPLPPDFAFESVDLDFDHLFDKKGAVSNLIRSDYSWHTILEEIDKCRVLCKICHARHSRDTRASYNEHKNVPVYIFK